MVAHWLLLVLASVVGLGSCQHHALYTCPALLPLKGFYPDRFLGQWYIHRQYRVGAEEDMVCKSLTLNEDGSATFDFSARGKPYTVSGNFLVDASADGIMKATFDYSDVLGTQEDGEVIWYILSTDYNSFAIISSCQEESILHKQYVYFLSREPEPSPYQRAVMDVAFLNTHFPPGGTLEVQSHGSCSAPTRVTSPSAPSTPEVKMPVKQPVSSPSQVSENLLVIGQQADEEPAPIVLAPTPESSAPILSGGSDTVSPAAALAAANHYEEIDLEGIPLLDGADSRLTSLLDRMKLSRNFVQWRNIVDQPRVRVAFKPKNREVRNRPYFLRPARRTRGTGK